MEAEFSQDVVGEDGEDSGSSPQAPHLLLTNLPRDQTNQGMIFPLDSGILLSTVVAATY